MIINIEETLGFYQKEMYLDNKSILPAEYEDTYNKKTPSHFKTLYSLLLIICILDFLKHTYGI